MATIVWFRQALHDLGKGVHDFTTNDLKVAIVKSTAALSGGLADPRWGDGGGTDLSAHEVATGDVYLAGGLPLENVTWSLQSNGPVLRAATITMSRDEEGGFEDGAAVVIYNDTDPGKACIAYGAFGTTQSLKAKPIVLDWQGATNDILSLRTA